jgi:Ca2+-binding RTX toxin-like protein
MTANIETLEPRRLFTAAAPTFHTGADGVVEITGTNRRDVITVVEHFPGSGIFDVQYSDTFAQVNTFVGFRIDGGGGDDRLAIQVGVSAPITTVTIRGGKGNDVLLGSPFADRLDGGAGRDHLDGRAGDDELHGGAGNDSLLGNGGADQLFGGAGADFLDGGDGSDDLAGGPGRDGDSGGAGADFFDDSIDGEREHLDVTLGDDFANLPELP